MEVIKEEAEKDTKWPRISEDVDQRQYLDTNKGDSNGWLSE